MNSSASPSPVEKAEACEYPSSLSPAYNPSHPSPSLHQLNALRIQHQTRQKGRPYPPVRKLFPTRSPNPTTPTPIISEPAYTPSQTSIASDVTTESDGTTSKPQTRHRSIKKVCMRIIMLASTLISRSLPLLSPSSTHTRTHVPLSPSFPLALWLVSSVSRVTFLLFAWL